MSEFHSAFVIIFGLSFGYAGANSHSAHSGAKSQAAPARSAAATPALLPSICAALSPRFTTAWRCARGALHWNGEATRYRIKAQRAADKIP